jgi:hypothetical protein
MTRALSVAATTHLISPPPGEATTNDARREVAALQQSLDADRRTEQVRQAAMEAELADHDRTRAREVNRVPERAREAEGARP